MTGAYETDTPEGQDPEATVGDGLVAVDWNVRTRRRLRGLGLAGSVTGGADVVVVDRRGGETTPAGPGELTLDGRRVLVVPDRRDGAPPVELWAAGGRDRYGSVVEVLRRSVVFDARVEAAFESACRRHRLAREDPAVRADGGRSTSAVESVALGLEATNTALAVGGFAAAIETLR